MKKILLLFIFGLLYTFPAHALTLDTSSESDRVGIFATLEKINKENTSLSELEGQINFEKQKIDSQSSAIDSLDELHTSVLNAEKELEILEDSFSGTQLVTPEVSSALSEKKEAFSKKLSEYLGLLGYESTIEKIDYTFYKQNKKDIEKKYSEVLKALSTEIIDAERFLVSAQSQSKSLQESINKSQIAFQIQIKDMAIKFAIFVVLFFILHFTGIIVQKTIKAKEGFSEEKRQVLLGVLKWTKNILLLFLVIVFFFSEFLTILPFLAILGTALGFALKDVISSFIAWIIIGMKDSIYSVGEIIELDDEKILGKITKISPLRTFVQELGLSGPSGMYRSFPNNKIFDKTIRNHSRQKGWMYVTFDFLLDLKSDIYLAKNLLLETMNEITKQQKFSSPMSHKGFLKKFGYTEEMLQPQVFLDSKLQGVFLRGKILVLGKERYQIKTEVMEKFTEKTRAKKSIEFRYQA